MNEEVLHDIHPPMVLPEEPNYLFIATVAIVAVFLIGLLIWFFFLRKKKVHIPGPHERALADLVQLRGVMEQGDGERYAIGISSILRNYVEERFKLPSSRQTSSEFFRELTNSPATGVGQLEQHVERLKECLERCDLAKFAKCTPERQQMETMEQAVQKCIEDTMQNSKKGEA